MQTLMKTFLFSQANLNFSLKNA